MAIEKEINLNVKSNIEGSIGELKALKRELKGVDVGTEEFKKLFNQIDDLEDKIKSAKNKSSDWIDSLQNAGGPIGMVGSGLNSLKVSTQSFGAALKATGIGLIVIALGGLAAAFSQNDNAMKKLKPLLDGMQKILQGIFKAVEPLLDAFLDLAMQALPYVTQGIGLFYSALVGLFTLVKEVGGGYIKMMKGIITLDFDAAKEGFNQMKDSFSKAVKSGEDAYAKFQSGSKEQTASEKEELAKRREEQRKHNEELAKKQKEAAEKDAEERKRIAAEKKKQREEEAKQEKDFLDKLSIARLDNIAEDARIKADAGTKQLESLNNIALLGDAIDEDFSNKKKERTAKEVEIEKAAADQKQAIQEASFKLAENVVGFISAIAGKNKILQKAAVIGESAIGIAKMIIANNTANIAALATPQAVATSGASALPVIAMNNISTGLGVASTIAATAKALSALGGGAAPSGGAGAGGGGGVSAPAAPSFNVVGNSGVNQIAGVMQQQGAPVVKTYVTAGDVTTAQGLNRNIVSNATLG